MKRARRAPARRSAGATRRKPKSRATAKARTRRARATRRATPKRAAGKRAVRRRAAPAATRGRRARKTAPKRARRPTRKSAAHRPARKAAAKRPVRSRPAAKRTPRKTAPRRTPRKAAPRRAPAALRPVRRAPVAPAFPQRSGASSKQELLFDLVRARVGVHAALQGLEAGGVTEPVAGGKWSVLEHALHLVHRDHEATQAMEAALRGIPPRWAGFDKATLDRFNAEGIASLQQLSWDEARRALLTARLHMIEEIEAVPEEPGEVWSAQHPFAAMLRDVAENDRHHAEIIKRWRGTRGA